MQLCIWATRYLVQVIDGVHSLSFFGISLQYFLRREIHVAPCSGRTTRLANWRFPNSALSQYLSRDRIVFVSVHGVVVLVTTESTTLSLFGRRVSCLVSGRDGKWPTFAQLVCCDLRMKSCSCDLLLVTGNWQLRCSFVLMLFTMDLMKDVQMDWMPSDPSWPTADGLSATAVHSAAKYEHMKRAWKWAFEKLRNELSPRTTGQTRCLEIELISGSWGVFYTKGIVLHRLLRPSDFCFVTMTSQGLVRRNCENKRNNVLSLFLLRDPLWHTFLNGKVHTWWRQWEFLFSGKHHGKNCVEGLSQTVTRKNALFCAELSFSADFFLEENCCLLYFCPNC